MGNRVDQATQLSPSASPPTESQRPRRAISYRRRPADRVYRGISTGAGLLTLVLLVLIGLFLLQKGWPALQANGLGFFTGTDWTANGPFGVAAVLYWTVVIAAIALVLALPLAVAAALYITELAPRRLRRPMTTLIDLLAAVPSLIYGLWGLYFLQPRLIYVSKWLGTHAGFIPLFGVDGDPADVNNYKASAFVAGIVVGLMIVPIITSIVREVFSQVPQGEKEAALALGGRRWGMIKAVVLPFGKGGIIGGAMLGLGRALGEVVIVVLIISPTFTISPHILQTGANSVASLITLRLSDAHGLAVNALMAAGLALFVITLLVNMVASAVVARSRSGAGVEL